MIYQIIWHDDIFHDLKSIDIGEAKAIINKINTSLIKDPQSLGKPLTSEYKGFFRYRYGNYRVIYSVDNINKLIKVLYISHRKNVYKKIGRN